MGLNLLNHLIEQELLVRIKLRSKLILSAKENESEDFGVIKVEVALFDHCVIEIFISEALHDNPLKGAIVWDKLPLLAAFALTFISIGNIRCLNLLFCGVSEFHYLN